MAFLDRRQRLLMSLSRAPQGQTTSFAHQNVHRVGDAGVQELSSKFIIRVRRAVVICRAIGRIKDRRAYVLSALGITYVQCVQHDGDF